MIGVIILVVALLILVIGGLIMTTSDADAAAHRRAVDLGQRARAADQQIQSEHRAAKRAMNIAAGQSWRNLID